MMAVINWPERHNLGIPGATGRHGPVSAPPCRHFLFDTPHQIDDRVVVARKARPIEFQRRSLWNRLLGLRAYPHSKIFFCERHQLFRPPELIDASGAGEYYLRPKPQRLSGPFASGENVVLPSVIHGEPEASRFSPKFLKISVRIHRAHSKARLCGVMKKGHLRFQIK